MTLLDNFKPDAEDNLPVHQFVHAGMFWALGVFSRADMISKFNLQASDESQLDELAAFYTGLPNNQKFLFIQKAEGALELYEAGLMTEQEVKTQLGLT